jgi:hypothetical protein
MSADGKMTRLLGVILSFLFLTMEGLAVRVDNDTPLDTNTPTLGSQYCVDVGPNQATCVADPMSVWTRMIGPNIIHDMNTGVEQRVDGTEAEQNSIRNVLRLMNVYWQEEVLSNSDYEDVRLSW